jgi:hypothetical protein
VPISYTVDREQRRLTTRAEGHFGLADIEAYVRAKEEDLTLGYDELIDARGATTTLTADEVSKLVDRFQNLIADARLGRIAFLADDDYLVRLVAMFSNLVLPLGVVSQVFRQMDLADEWLSVEGADASGVTESLEPAGTGSQSAWTCPHCGFRDWLRNKKCPKCGRFENEPRLTRS